MIDAALAREIGELTLEHISMVLISCGIASAAGIALGILLTRHAALRGWVLGFAGVMQTVPSLALFGFLIPIPLIGGIGKRTAILALVLYALLPILRNTLVGILGVDAAVRESAVAMGMTGRQLLWEVELPLASRTILAGVRVATVTTIGTATIAAAIGGGGLGVFIFRGLASVDSAQILAGAIPAALMALVAEGGLEWLQSANRRRSDRGCCCWPVAGRADGSWSARRISPSRSSWAKSSRRQSSGVLAVEVDRKLNLGGTLLAHQALVSGSIDVYPEYTGTALTAVLKLPISRDAAGVAAQVRSEYRSRWNIEWMPPLGFNNTFAMVIDKGFETLSEAAGRKRGMEAGSRIRIPDASRRPARIAPGCIRCIWMEHRAAWIWACSIRR